MTKNYLNRNPKNFFKISGDIYKKLSLKHCNTNKYGSYTTLNLAKLACLSDANCRGVYDTGCNDKDEYTLCDGSRGFDKSGSSCVYEKWSNLINIIEFTIFQNLQCAPVII